MHTFTKVGLDALLTQNEDLPFFCHASTAVDSIRAGKTEPQQQQQLGAAVHPVFATVEVA